MIITSVQTLRCGAGFRDFCFVKICTDGTSPEGKPIVGWSEYLEERNIGITQVIEWMGELVMGQDPLPFEKILSNLRAVTRHVAGGIAAQGIAAIENGILDIVGKFYGVPVCALFGGPVRTELEVYWSHCGSFRVSYADQLQNPDTGAYPVPPLQTLDDMQKLGEEVAASGWKALKTNIFEWADEQTGTPASMYMAGFGGGMGGPELNIQQDQIERLVEQMRALRSGCGNSIGLKLDLNYNFKTDGYIRIAQALTPEALGGAGIDWLELDLYEPNALRQIRDAAPMPIASLESLIGCKSYLPYLQAGAVDVAIIDTLWNGVGESVKIAGLCDTFEVNCAAHNYHGWLGTAISAHFCASIPNFKVLEVDVDDVPWKDEIVSIVPRIENSTFYMPTGPGWGVDINEEALKKYPPVNDPKTGMWSAMQQGGAPTSNPAAGGCHLGRQHQQRRDSRL